MYFTKLSSKAPLHYSIIFVCFSEEFVFFITLKKESDSDPLLKIVLESRCYRKGDFNSEYERNFLKIKWLKMKWTAL